jgi:hypothetical protein
MHICRLRPTLEFRVSDIVARKERRNKKAAKTCNSLKVCQAGRWATTGVAGHFDLGHNLIEIERNAQLDA